MKDPKKPKYSKMARRRQRLLALAVTYEQSGDGDTAQHYRDVAHGILGQLQEAKVCLRCGRKLIAPGVPFGPECERSLTAAQDIAIMQAAVETVGHDRNRSA